MKNRKRNRMKGFDYSSDNLYFVTICVKDRVCCFGEILENAERTAHELSVHKSNQSNSKKDRSNYKMKLNKFGLIVQERLEWLPVQYQYAVMHNYVVMPNHVHAVVEIDSLKVLGKEVKIKPLSGLVGAFKTTSSKLIHEAGFLGFSWQRSFHDHIIRTQQAYQNISNYIDMNPLKWQQDSLFSEV